MSPSFNIAKIDSTLVPLIQAELDNKTKPLASLGRLEELAMQCALVQNSLRPSIQRPSLLLFAADHGIASNGASPYPQSVTAAMLKNFANGGAAINVLSRTLGWQLQVIDAGTLEAQNLAGVDDCRQGAGTQNVMFGPAMDVSQVQACLRIGAERVRLLAEEGCNTIALGEMGIGNSSSAALLLHCLSNLSLADSVSRGAGSNDQQLAHKLALLQTALKAQGRIADPWQALRCYGGFELAMIVGAALAAAERRMLVIVDGLIVSAALLVAIRAYPEILPFLVFAHRSAAQGHAALLEEIRAKPLLDLGLCLGEGTGAALALPLLQSATALLSEMASFASAGIAQKRSI